MTTADTASRDVAKRLALATLERPAGDFVLVIVRATPGLDVRHASIRQVARGVVELRCPDDGRAVTAIMQERTTELAAALLAAVAPRTAFAVVFSFDYSARAPALN